MRTDSIGKAQSSLPVKTLIILVTDDTIPAVAKSYGTYHHIFSTLFARSLEASGSQQRIRVDSYEVLRDEYPDQGALESAQTLLITGSASSAYAEQDWITRLIRFVATLPGLYPRLRIIGICFGHQIISMAFGGGCILNEAGWEIGVREIQLTDVGKRLFPSRGSTIRVHQMHRDIAPAVSPGFEPLGSTSICSNHGMVRFNEQGQVQIVSIQGHPEFHRDILDHLIDSREAKGILTPDVVQQSRIDAAKQDDGVAIGIELLRMTDLVGDAKPAELNGFH